MQLAQLNIAESLFPMTSPEMDSFTGRINAINALADRAPGFVWRLTDDDEAVDGALSLRLPGNVTALVNMSVWDDVQSLYMFVYKTAHAKVMSANTQKFLSILKNHFVLWWVEDGHVPDVAEAHRKLQALNATGPSAEAFDFKTPYDCHGAPLHLEFPKKDCA